MTPSRSRIEVRPVRGNRERDAFIRLPFALYRDDPNWVPPLLIERRRHLSRRHNPYFEHAETEMWLAWRDGRPVGRISAQDCRLFRARHDASTGHFGMLEGENDPAIFDALFEAAADWLRSRGLGRVIGPFSLSINEESGLLVAGFDSPPSVMMGHARPYYAEQLERMGFTPVKDLLAYDYDARPELPRAMRSMVERVGRSGNIVIRPLDKARLDEELRLVMDIFNDAWSDNWGFVPMTQAEVTAMGRDLRFLVEGDYIQLAYFRDEPAAMAVSLPNLNAAIADLGGRLLPFGWTKLLWRVKMRPPVSARIPLMGVRRKHHGTIVGSALAIAVIDAIRAYHTRRGTCRAELSWILEDNAGMRRIIEQIGGRAYKTYRIYGRDI